MPTPEMTIGSTMIVRQIPLAGSTEFTSTASPRPAIMTIGTVTIVKSTVLPRLSQNTGSPAIRT